MTNFTLHDQAQQLADTRSAYSLARELLELQASRPVWRNTGAPNGLRRFMTQKQYDAQTPGVQQWYEPIRHETPEGWKLVPLELTKEMSIAVYRLDDAMYAGGNNHGASIEQCWDCLLDAAPKPGEL